MDLLFLHVVGAGNLEVSEFREVPDKIQDLTTRTFRLFESEEPESLCEVSKVPLNVRHETGYVETIHPELLEVRECREVTEG